ncbi:nitric oxide-associated protein 1 isoform X2 [Festucalex cinctus]
MLNAARVAATLRLGFRRSTGWSVSLPGSKAAPGRTSSDRTAGRLPRGLERSCTVDPAREERFWYQEGTDLENEEEAALVDAVPPPNRPPPTPAADSARRTSSGSERRALADASGPDPQAESLIRFHDADFPLPHSLLASHKKKKAGHKIYGTPDREEPASDTHCSGCGATLHCAHAAVPGYLPSEKYKALLREERLNGATCQRCHLLRHHQKALNVQVSKDEFREVVREIRSRRALVLLIVDLLDVPDSLVPDLPDLLTRFCEDAGFGSQVSDVHLISAKTGYGVEELISGLQRSWKYKGDVYLVGGANAGKSTLFNALLQSDYCKSRASDLIGKATVSPWPGTTLNLLKFPIINPTPYRMFRRQRRLEECRRRTDDDLPPDQLKKVQDLRRQGYLVGHVGRTFLPKAGRATVSFHADALAFGENDDGETAPTGKEDERPGELTYKELKDAHWLFDTPGITKEHDILHLLQQQEVRAVVPTRAIIPRTFVLKAGMSLFVGALARIDFLEGEKSCWFSVVAAARLPVHISTVEKADAIYQKHAGGDLLGVPAGGAERMKDFPPLVPQDFRLEGRGPLEATADIKLSSAGWVAVTALEGQQPLLRLHGPPLAAFGLRTPPLLPHVVSLKGARVPKSAAYKAPTPAVLLDVGLRRQRHKKKKNKKDT